MNRKERKERIGALRMKLSAERSKIGTMTKEERTAFDGELAELERLNADEHAEERIDSLTSAPQIHQLVPEKDLRSFSVINVVRSLAGLGGDIRREQEISAELRKGMGLPETGGILVPTQLRSTTTAAPAVVGKQVAEYASALYYKTALEKLGVRMLGGLVGDVEFPTQATALQGTAKGEVVSADQATLSIPSAKAQPHRIPVQVPISKQLLLQSSPDIEAYVRDEIAMGMGSKIEYYALQGDGLNGAPTGILSTSNIGTVSNANSTFTYANVLAAKAVLAKYPIVNPGWIVGTTAYEKLASKEIASNTAKFVFNDDNQTMGGLRAEVNGNMLASGVLLADWARIILCSWGATDLVVDPYTAARTGQLLITATAFMDIVVRYPSLVIKNANAISA